MTHDDTEVRFRIPMTKHQHKLIQVLCADNHLTDDSINSYCRLAFGKDLDRLDRREASNFIEYLQGLTVRDYQ